MARKLGTRPQEPIPKPRYRVTNWPEYDHALVERGSVTLWLSDEVAMKWPGDGVRAVARGAFTGALRSAVR